jgi:hypothetical protein
VPNAANRVAVIVDIVHLVTLNAVLIIRFDLYLRDSDAILSRHRCTVLIFEKVKEHPGGLQRTLGSYYMTVGV